MKIINKFDAVILLTIIIVLSTFAIKEKAFIHSFVLGILLSIPILLPIVYVILTQDVLNERNMKRLVIFCAPLGFLFSLIIGLSSVETYVVSLYMPQDIITSLGFTFSVVVCYELASRYALMRRDTKKDGP